MRYPALILWLAGAAYADLGAARAEPDLGKRSELAMLNAESTLDRVRKAYQAADDRAAAAAISEVTESMNLCKEALDASGKNARKSPKYFKKAELGLRRLIRRLDTLRFEFSVDDRAPVDKLLAHAHQLQDQILAAIMGPKK